MQQAWNYRAHVAGKTNLQFSLSILKPPVYGTCPLETEQTAVKMFKRLCSLRYLCSWIPIDCFYIKGGWWQGTTFRASGEVLTPPVSSRAKMCLMPLHDVVWRRICACAAYFVSLFSARSEVNTIRPHMCAIVCGGIISTSGTYPTDF